MEIVSLAEAARLTKKSRNTLKSHLKSGRLSGSKDENGDWQIQVSELIRVYNDLSGTKEKDQGKAAPNGQSRPSIGGDSDLVAENAVLKERLAQQGHKYSDEKSAMEDQIDFLKKQIDKKDSHLTMLTAQIEDHRERRAKTEDRAEEKEKELAVKLAQYQGALKQARQAQKEQERRYRVELEEAKQSAGWFGLLRQLTGAGTNQRAKPAAKQRVS